MKQFNLEEAKAGASVCTRNGRDVRIICFDRLKYPIVALIKNSEDWEEAYTYNEDGKIGLQDSEYDLFMKEGEPNINDYTTIKTYEDACKALGEPPISIFNVGIWNGEDGFDDVSISKYRHILALMKLETISKALRNGWEPMDCKKRDDMIHIPVFAEDEFDELNWQYADGAFLGKNLYQETEAKAEYFGTQFIDLWKEYLQFED